MSNPVISCVMPTHGRAHHVCESVQSYLNQIPCGVETELVILNDCPEQTLTCDLPGVRVINVPLWQGDLSTKFNEAVALAAGEYIAWWEDDDISLPFRLSHSLKVAQQTKAGYVKQSHAWCWNSGRVDEWSGKCLFYGSAFFRKDYYIQCGGATPGQWCDQSAHANMASGGSYHCEPSTMDTTHFVYRWAGVGHHYSGFSLDNDACKAEHRRRTLSDPRFVHGNVTIVPTWRQDYWQLTKDFRQSVV